MEKVKILIADDDELVLDIYEMILEGAFHSEIVSAKNGREAINFLGQKDSAIDLIISDYNMPLANGGELFQFNKSQNNVPMFIISGGDLEDYSNLNTFLTANKYNKYFTKPFNEELIIKSAKLVLNEKEDKIIGKSDKKELIKVKLKHYIQYSQTASEVYIKLHGDKLTRIVDLNESNLLDMDLLHHYYKKNIEYVYISKEHFFDLINESLILFKEKLEERKPPTEILRVAGLQFHISLSGFESIGINERQISLVFEIVDDVITELSKYNESILNLKHIIEREDFLISHSMITMIVASYICTETPLVFGPTMKKICIASFFHDFSLADCLHINHEFKIHEITDKKTLQKVLEHPMQSANALPAMMEIFDDIKKIILEHHELPNGDGYPKNLNASQISHLSCLFILSQQITFCLIRNNFDKERLKNFLVNNEVIYNQGNFARYYGAAVKKFIN